MSYTKVLIVYDMENECMGDEPDPADELQELLDADPAYLDWLASLDALRNATKETDHEPECV